MQRYHDSPQVSTPELSEYYDFVPPAQRPSGTNFNNYSHSDIPLVDNPSPTRPMDRNYANIDASRSNQWLEKQESSSRRSKRIVIGSALALLVLIVVGVVAGVVIAKNAKKSPVSGAKAGKTGPGSNVPQVVNQTNPNDPSTFVKDSRLKQSFYGIAYTPEGSQLPNCGNSLPAVIQDMQLLSQLTKRIRLYGADCNQSALVLEAIKQTKIDMTVFLGNYAIPGDNNAAYNRQRDVLKSALTTYGTDHIGGITVGNEYMLNYLTDHASSDPNSAVGNQGAALLIANIQDTRSMLKSMSLDGKVPVGNSDAGSYFNTQVLSAVDYGLSNVHPWFANTTIQAAAGWTSSFFQTTNVQPAALLANKPKMYIAETGWPTKSSDAGNANNGASAASEANLQIFLDTFVCQANKNGTGYFFFEYFDEQWKDIQFGGVEGWWGLFYQNRTLKGITIPDCPSP
jgi:exo-beta-1,3-glucanase (GH17 family)